MTTVRPVFAAEPNRPYVYSETGKTQRGPRSIVSFGGSTARSEMWYETKSNYAHGKNSLRFVYARSYPTRSTNKYLPFPTQKYTERIIVYRGVHDRVRVGQHYRARAGEVTADGSGGGLRTAKCWRNLLSGFAIWLARAFPCEQQRHLEMTHQEEASNRTLVCNSSHSIASVEFNTSSING